MSKTIVVFGATGTSGFAVASALASSAKWTVKGVTRSRATERVNALSAQGIQIVEADLNHSETVKAAIVGADAVYLAGPSKLDQWNSSEAMQGMGVIDAAMGAAVQHFIYQSALVRDARGVLGNGSKRAIEERLAELPIHTTILRPGVFMDNLSTHSRPYRAGGGWQVAMALPLNKVMGWVSADDIGRAAEKIASGHDGEPWREYEVVAEVTSLQCIASILSEIAEANVEAIEIPIERIAASSPPVAAVYRWLSNRDAVETTLDLQRLSINPTPFASWARLHMMSIFNQ